MIKLNSKLSEVQRGSDNEYMKTVKKTFGRSTLEDEDEFTTDDEDLSGYNSKQSSSTENDEGSEAELDTDDERKSKNKNDSESESNDEEEKSMTNCNEISRKITKK